MMGTDRGRKKAPRLFLTCLSALTVITGFAFSDVTQAQGIDSSIIKKFEQQMQRGGNRSTQTSPVDQSRNQSDTVENDLGRPQDIEALRRQAKPSAIELDYESRTNEKLKQFGYDMFGRSIAGGGQVTGRIPDHYVVGIGDEVVVTFNGPEPRSISTQVDSEGRLVVEGLPPIAAAGRRFGDLEAEIKARTHSSLIGTEAFVSIGGARAVSVYVVGEVDRPGLYRLTSMSSVLEALTLAGGVKKTGSLRAIKVGGRTVDLYHVFGGTSTVDLHVTDGARIVVPPLGPTVAIAGGVVRPGIYELPKGSSQSLSSILGMAGGSLRPRGYSYVLNRIEADGRQNIATIASVDQAAHDGDILTVGLRRDVQVGGVSMVGHVRTPGLRSIREVPTIKDLLGDGMMMKDQPYMLFGVVESSDPTTQARLLRPFSPEQVIYGKENFPLRDKDRVILFGQAQVDFLTALETRRVVLTGVYDPKAIARDEPRQDSKPSKRPERCEPLEDLARIVSDTKSDRYVTAIRAVFVQLDVTNEEIGKSETSLAERKSVGAAKLGISSDGSTQIEQPATPQQVMQQQPLPYQTLEQLEEEAAEKKQEEERREVACPQIYREVRGLLPFVLEYVASADGAVRRPGVYPLVDGTPLSSLIAVAGGTVFNADLTNLELIGSDLNPETGANGGVTGQLVVDATTTDLTRITLSPASGVRFNSKTTNQEAGAVLLSGEFKRPGVYPIQRGEKLSDIIARAGGLSEHAYPYGAVFTRTRVKEEQKRGFERTARELNLGLATAALKQRDLKPETLMAGQQLADKLATADVLGRVVIEADPRVLVERPELDTVLEPGDRIVMPKRPNYVLMIGDLLNPGALQFIKGKRVQDYVHESGGPLRTADDGRTFVVYPNGVARPVKLSSWGFSTNVTVPPGTAIVVPKDVEPIDTMQLVRDISAIFSQLAVSAASIAVISR
ncbi:SLBB domain-containing protein [Govanella unica]|uniref:SLBB domain-containing protein n=1 Tax=Govanella unica TaxID=2975056 RepID=A0A9X3TXA6_9PROT|nr:SLBB domain-containing protein [Govania unica]MDA5193390.1 SLBB domain-containing protein [Govania unica]